MAVNQSLFRPEALEHYQHMQQPKTLPKFTSPLTLFWYWLLFFVMVAAIVIPWLWQVPVFERGAGVLQQLTAQQMSSYGLTDKGQGKQTIGIVFFPEGSSTTLRSSTPISLSVSNSAQPFTGQLQHTRVQTLTAQEISQQYQGAVVGSSIPQVFTVAFVVFKAPPAVSKNGPVAVAAQYQTGTLAVLPLLLKTVSVEGSA